MWLFLCRAGILPDFDQCPSNHTEILYQGGRRGKTKELLDCQDAIKLAVSLQSKQTPSCPARSKASLKCWALPKEVAELLAGAAGELAHCTLDGLQSCF